MKNLKINTLRGILTFMLLSMPATISGCGKTVKCDVKGEHAHLYTNEEGYAKYLEDEHETYKGFNRDDEYIEIKSEEKELYSFLKDKGLLSINDNLEILVDELLVNEDYQEYRYTYIYLMPIPHVHFNGKTSVTTYSYIPTPGRSWTNDATHGNLTGEERTVHYVYQAYKVIIDEKGNYALEASEYVDDLRDIMDEYPYIKLDHSKKVNLYTNEELDYEDGPEEEHELVDEDEITESKNNDSKSLK